MKKILQQDPTHFHKKLKTLILLRVIISIPLFFTIYFVQAANNISAEFRLAVFLYGIPALLVLSVIYAIILAIIKQGVVLFAYFQLIVDTFFVTVIVYLTGGFYSIFLFLYFVVIIYSSMILFGKGSLVMASLSSIQYGILVDFEYFSMINPVSGFDQVLAADYVWSVVFYKILFTMVSCFAVAILSSLLAIEAKKARKEVLKMEAHVKRVEKMAAIGEMAAGLAHEIKNPLASLSGAIQLLKDNSQYTPDNDKLMKIALREADRLSALLNDFLMFARPKTGNPTPVELAVLLEEVLDLFENDPEVFNKVSIVKEFIPGIRIEIDSVQLHQVLLNLLMNSLQAIEASGIITLRMVPSGGHSVDLEIMDNGCGMSEETLSQIFDPFFTTKSKGIGLGLSIVHRILETYNCRIDVVSSVGKGTKFTLNFKIHSWIKDQPKKNMTID